jgi:hypothetical protein
MSSKPFEYGEGIFPLWSHQMNSMVSSSRMERELPSNGVVGKAMVKDLGKACQNVIRA